MYLGGMTFRLLSFLNLQVKGLLRQVFFYSPIIPIFTYMKHPVTTTILGFIVFIAVVWWVAKMIISL